MRPKTILVHNGFCGEANEFRDGELPMVQFISVISVKLHTVSAIAQNEEINSAQF